MLRKNKYYGKFKSHTDVNNYNKFLADLDKKITLKQEKETELQQTNKKNIAPVPNIPILTKNFSGLSPIDILINAIETNLDPNLYTLINKNNSSNSTPNLPKKFFNSEPILKKSVHIDVNINSGTCQLVWGQYLRD